MKVALFIGDHTKDTPGVRLGWWLTRLVQKGSYSNVTHVEAILKEWDDGSVTIASSSLRDGGIRMKRCVLTPGHWDIVDVPIWDSEVAEQWFFSVIQEAIERTGHPPKYDWRGALVSWLPFLWGKDDEWFCNEAVGASVGLECPEIFGPSQFAAICHSLK